MTIFIVLHHGRAIVRVHSVHAMNTETAPGGHRPLDQVNRLKPQARLYRQPVNRIHHRHLLSLLSPKDDTHFTVPRRVEGWVDFGGCCTPSGLPVRRRSPNQVLTGLGVDVDVRRAQRRYHYESSKVTIFRQTLNFSDKSQQLKINKNIFLYLLDEKRNSFRLARCSARNPVFY